MNIYIHVRHLVYYIINSVLLFANMKGSNKINSNDCSFIYVPIKTILNYFCWNYENIYFLLLALLQLSTISLLPKEWSPTGPYSTAVPLFLCLLLEIILNMYMWINKWKSDNMINNKPVICLKENGEYFGKKTCDLESDDIIKITKNDIVPIDCTLVSCKERYGKISLVLLNGESNYTYVIPEKQIIPKNSIVKSEELLLRAISQKEAIYDKLANTYKKSNLDKHVSANMINISTRLLMIIIFVMSLIKLHSINHEKNIYFTYIIIVLQTWILFNGIIPFSVKILLIFIRNIQSTILNNISTKSIHINNPNLIDDIPKIKRILADKTGTITENKLNLVKYTDLNDIYNAENSMGLNIDLLKCLVLCIHKTEGNYDTVEDMTVRNWSNSLDLEIIEKNGIIEFLAEGNKYVYEYIDYPNLDFTFDRKMSTKIVKDIDNNKYYMFTKGSIEKIKEKSKEIYKPIIDKLENRLEKECPELRSLAYAFKEITEDYDESDLDFLGIICINDNLQDGVENTVKFFESKGISTSILTGDRLVTAFAIGKKAGIIDEDNHNNTMIFSGKDFTDSSEEFKKQIINSHNFIAYSLKPQDKALIAEIFEKNDIPVLSVGDGFNDINMFNTTSISTAIAGNKHVENSADFVIAKFSDIVNFLKVGKFINNKNLFLVNYTFYRATMQTMVLVTNCIIEYNQPIRTCIDGFVLQGFNFAWCVFPILYNSINMNEENDDTDKKRNTIFWIFSGIFGAIILTCLTHYSYGTHRNYKEIIGFVLIIILNLTMFFGSLIDLKMIGTLFIGPILYMIYVMCQLYLC